MNLEAELEALGVPPIEAPKPNAALFVEAPKVRAVTDQVHPMAANWAKWKDRFGEAMVGNFHTLADLERLVFSNQAQLWCGANAALVTQIQNYPGGERTLQVLWMAGDVNEAIGMAPGVESFGRSMGCTSVLIEGRPAWVKLLKGHGYDAWSATVRKPL